MFLFDIFSLFVVLSLFSNFFIFLLCQPILGGLHLFWGEFFLSFLRRALLWKFLRSPTQNWNVKLNFFKFRSKCLKNCVYNFFSNDLRNIGKTIKTPSFYDDTYLHISSISLTLDESLLTEIYRSICRLKHVKREHIPMKILFSK